jgi:hypothetical protein
MKMLPHFWPILPEVGIFDGAKSKGPRLSRGPSFLPRELQTAHPLRSDRNLQQGRRLQSLPINHIPGRHLAHSIHVHDISAPWQSLSKG